MIDAPLDGVRVLDLTRLLPGPMCTLYLADLGADVVKVEDTGAGDYARNMGGSPQGSAVRSSTWYRTLNRNKRSIAIDLKHPAGHAAFLTLARNANVIVESFRPGVVASLGVDDESVRNVNPRVVYCALTGYGQTGPRAAAPGHDINYLGYAGTLAYSGVTGGAPALANLQIADLLGGAASSAIAILAALFAAERTGRGRYIDVAMTDAVFAHQVFLLGALEDRGVVPPRGEDLLTGGVPCYGVYETRDGRWLAVGALELKFWRTLCETLERPDLVDRHMATGNAGADTRAALARIFASATLAEWRRRLENVPCCVTPILAFDEALRDPQLVARETTIISSDGTRQLTPPFKLSPPAFRVRRDAPAQGEHTDEVLREAGYADEAIDVLVRDGAVKRGVAGRRIAE